MDTPEPSPREAEQRAYAREVAKGILTKHHREQQSVEQHRRLRQAERFAGVPLLRRDLVLGGFIFVSFSVIAFAGVHQAQEIGERRSEVRQTQVELERLSDELAGDDTQRPVPCSERSAGICAQPTDSPSIFDTVQDQQREEISELFAPVVDKAPEVLLTFGGVLGGWYVVKRGASTRRRRSSAIADVRERWDTAVARHDEIAEQYAAIRLDPVAAIDHMALWDVRDELTERFTLAYAKVTDARARYRVQPTDPDLVDAYADLVDRAHLAWTNAREHARQLGVEVLPAEQQDSARTARSLLVLAADKRADDFERESAAEKAAKRLAEIRGIRFPAEATKAIRTTARKAIEA